MTPVSGSRLREKPKASRVRSTLAGSPEARRQAGAATPCAAASFESTSGVSRDGSSVTATTTTSSRASGESASRDRFACARIIGHAWLQLA